MMKLLLFIILAGYAVKCDVNNYYVIEMPDDQPTPKPFGVYWNVPTMQCSSKKIRFENLFEKFGIIQNTNDAFRGNQITIMYDPGLFPALLKNETSGKFKFRNGGVPQEGDLSKHLDAFKKDLDLIIPDEDFSGIGIIDFESWRPILRQNFGVLRPYKDVSYEIEKELHWWWRKSWIEAEAKRRFEDSARTFMQTTLSMAKRLRPRARWGFYGFPYCFNIASNNMLESCARHVNEENDRLSWLWSESTALYPSVYSSVELTSSQLASLIRGRMKEARRCAESDAILPYFWFRYRDAEFLTETDLNTALSTLYKSNATGFIVWGSSNDVNTVEKCNKLLNYIETVFGPAIAKYTKPPNRVNDENDINSIENNVTIDKNNIDTTISPEISETTKFITKANLDPEFHWIPPKNYTQDIKTRIEEQIKKKFIRNVTANHDAVLQNNSVLIDLILNSILISGYNSTYSNSQNNYSNDIKRGYYNRTDANRENNSFYNESSLKNAKEVLPVYKDLTSTITEQNIPEKVKQTSPNTSQVTINPLPNTNRGNDPKLDLRIDPITSTDSTKSSEVTTTCKPEATGIDNDTVTDNEDNEYFFNFETFIKETTTELTEIHTTESSLKDDFPKNTKKENTVKIEEVLAKFDYDDTLENMTHKMESSTNIYDLKNSVTSSETINFTKEHDDFTVEFTFSDVEGNTFTEKTNELTESSTNSFDTTETSVFSKNTNKSKENLKEFTESSTNSIDTTETSVFSKNTNKSEENLKEFTESSTNSIDTTETSVFSKNTNKSEENLKEFTGSSTNSIITTTHDIENSLKTTKLSTEAPIFSKTLPNSEERERTTEKSPETESSTDISELKIKSTIQREDSFPRTTTILDFVRRVTESSQNKEIGVSSSTIVPYFFRSETELTTNKETDVETTIVPTTTNSEQVVFYVL